MKKLFVSTMVAVVAIGSVNALAASKLLVFDSVEAIPGQAYTREELLTIPNDIQKEAMAKEQQEAETVKQPEAEIVQKETSKATSTNIKSKDLSDSKIVERQSLTEFMAAMR